VENAGVKNAGVDSKGGKCRSKPYGTPTRDYIEKPLVTSLDLSLFFWLNKVCLSTPAVSTPAFCTPAFSAPPPQMHNGSSRFILWRGLSSRTDAAESLKANSHRHARHDKTVLSVSRPLRRCELDSRQLRTVAEGKSGVWTRPEQLSNSHRHARHDPDWSCFVVSGVAVWTEHHSRRRRRYWRAGGQLHHFPSRHHSARINEQRTLTGGQKFDETSHRRGASQKTVLSPAITRGPHLIHGFLVPHEFTPNDPNGISIGSAVLSSSHHITEETDAGLGTPLYLRNKTFR